MTAMPSEVKELFESVHDVVFCTAAPDGQANGCVVAMKKVIDDETVYLSDQFFKKTLDNLLANPKVSIVFWKKKGGAYQIHGTARYVNEGEEYESQKAWVEEAFKLRGMDVTSKGGCYVHVDAVYQMAGGPGAGDQLA